MEVDERLLEYLREPEVQKYLVIGDFLSVYVGLMHTRFTYLGSQLTELLYKAQWNKLVPDREMSFDMDHDIIVYCLDGDLVMRGDGSLNV